MTGFNLISEPWIPVQRGGSHTEVSMRGLFEEAATFDSFAGLAATEEVALTRLLSAVIVAATGGHRTYKGLVTWIKEGLPAATITEYLELHQASFNLFDESRPFMQKLSADPDAEPTTIAALRLDMASGNNVALFSHTTDDSPPSLTPGEATIALLTTLLYQPGGGVSKPFNRTDSPGTKRVMGLMRGVNLLESLVLNTPIVDRNDRARPAWELEEEEVPDKEGRSPTGWLDLATWRSRAIRVYRDEDGLVRTCRIQQHLKLVDLPPSDPYVPVEKDKEGGERAVRPRAGESIWRQTDTIVHGYAQFARMERTVRTAAEIARATGRSHYPMLVVGLEVNQAKISDVHVSELPISSDFFEEDEARIVTIRWALAEQAEKAAEAVRAALWVACKELDVDVSSYPGISSAQEAYWHRLSSRFSLFMERLSTGADHSKATDQLRMDWNQQVRAAAIDAFNTETERFMTTGRGMRAVAVGRKTFWRKLPTKLEAMPRQEDD